MSGFDVPAEEAPTSGTVSISGSIDTNEASLAGNTIDSNSGNKSNGTQRVVLATDQPALMSALKVDGSAITQPVSISGTVPVSGTVGVTGVALDATLTGGTQQSRVTDGTNSANILKSDGTSAGQNAQLVAGTFKEVTFTTGSVQAVAVTDVSNYRWVSVHITSQGTGSTIAWQGSNDNINWVGASLQQLNNTVANAPSTSSSGVIYYGALSYRYFRLNVTGISSGTTAGTVEFFAVAPSLIGLSVGATQNGTWTVQPGNTANTTAWKVDGSAVTQPTTTTDGTNVANMLKSDGTAAGQNSQLVAGTFLEKTGSVALINNDLIAAIDVSNYMQGSIQVSGTWTGTINVQASNDNSNYVNIIIQSAISSSNLTSTITANGIYIFPINFRYLRIRATASMTGTAVGTAELYTMPQQVPNNGINAAQSGTWTVGATLSASTTGGYSYNNITTATTTTVKSGVGTLHSITINTPVASGTITIYDSTTGSGTKIGTITNPATLLQMGPLVAAYDIAFTTGLTIVTTGAQDITVVYK